MADPERYDLESLPELAEVWLRRHGAALAAKWASIASRDPTLPPTLAAALEEVLAILDNDQDGGAIKADRLSATRDDGDPYADLSELSRAFSLGDMPGTVKQQVPPHGAGNALAASEAEVLRVRFAEREATIRDLRARLDREAEQRQREAEESRREADERLRKADERLREAHESRRLSSPLPDQRSRPWWRRWFLR
jgi:hypothetical protein